MWCLGRTRASGIAWLPVIGKCSAHRGAEALLRYGAIRADLKLPPRPQHDAFEDALGAAEMYVLLEDMRERGVRLPRQRSEIQGDFCIA